MSPDAIYIVTAVWISIAPKLWIWDIPLSAKLSSLHPNPERFYMYPHYVKQERREDHFVLILSKLLKK